MKKILSIDGGGIKGVFPASFLAAIEKSLNVRVSDYFDLIVGTSTGGIIALGLGAGFTAGEVLRFYENEGPTIFKGNKLFKFFRHWTRSKYDPKNLSEALVRTFGNMKLGESKSRLVIPSFNMKDGEVYLYKTAHHPRFERDYKDEIVTVALSTSAAPTYFPVHNLSNGISLADGGIWANNPIGFAAVEGIGILEWPRDEIAILSIGCTSKPFKASGWGGKIGWVGKLADVFLGSQSSAAMGIAQHLVGKNNVIRINPLVKDKKFGIDAVAEIGDLKALGESEAVRELPHLRMFFDQKVEKFIPFKTI